MQVAVRMNSDTALTPLIDHPIWADVDEVGVYEHSVGHGIRAKDDRPFIHWLRDNEIPLTVEVSPFTEHSDNRLEVVQKILRAEPWIDAIQTDSARLKTSGGFVASEQMSPLNWTPEETADRLRPFFVEAGQSGVTIDLIEPFPALLWKTEVFPCIDRLMANETFPTRVIVDSNWWAVEWEAPRSNEWKNALRLAMLDANKDGRVSLSEEVHPDRVEYFKRKYQEYRDIYDFIVGAGRMPWILVGSPKLPDHPDTDEGFLSSALEQLEMEKSVLGEGRRPQGIIVQSWWNGPECGHGEQPRKTRPSVDVMHQIVRAAKEY